MKATRFVFIDDDKNSSDQWIEWAEYRGYKAEAVESVLEASKLVADFYVFDISAVAGILQPWNAYSPICTIINLHPGAIMVIVSAIPKDCIDEICNDVYEHCQVRPINGGWGPYELFEKALEGYL